LLRELAEWALRRRRHYRVSGTSMEPELHDGELILIEPTDKVGVGDVVVCRHPYRTIEIVKRVGSIDADGFISLSSPAGTDSDQFGRVPLDHVRGRVTSSISRRRVLIR
jgi:nickel-type superoxide dismutase maturation protease